ncbi:MAG: YIP1 family protein [Methanolinea sp.]|nr:YIP1 family protein [Methanolinea sp.]
MRESVPNKVRGFLFAPTLSFRRAKEEPVRDTVVYVVILAAFYSVMSAVLTALEIFVHPFAFASAGRAPVFDPLLLVPATVAVLVFSLAAAALLGLWLHAFVYIAGGRKGVWQTVKAVFYALTPAFILGWIPVIGLVVGIIWSVVTGVVGVRELHGLSDARAAIAVVLAVVLAAAIAIAVLGAVFLAVISRIPLTA